MHELSIAYGILEVAKTEAEKSNARKVHEIDVEIGTLAGVVNESLEFAMNAITRETIFQNTKLIIHEVLPLARCIDCNLEYTTSYLFSSCPVCNKTNTLLIRGKELRVTSLLIE